MRIVEDRTGGFILGSVDFVQWVKETYLSSRCDEKEIPGLRKLKPMIETDRIIDRVADEFECSRDTVLIKGRNGDMSSQGPNRRISNNTWENIRRRHYCPV